ncbi:MAG: damage-inducible protein DinB, partial [Cyclobacteriaceae bacterium]|nr:damage-inducible protein DinB [Cyclobacteriaceae bacterium]
VQFEKVVQYTNTKGQSFSNTVRDILFHVANHTTHHRGQIISDFRQSGIQPLVTDFIFYIRDKEV